MNLGPRDITRARDDMILEFIEQRIDGLSCAKIAKLHGVPRGTVITTTSAVLHADILHSGEDVAGAYWR